MNDTLLTLLEIPVLVLFCVLLFLPATALSTLGQWLLAGRLGFDRKQRRRVLWFPLLASVPVLLLAGLGQLGLVLPEILDYAVFVGMAYLYCRFFIPRLDRKQLWIFFPASIGLTFLAALVYRLFP